MEILACFMLNPLNQTDVEPQNALKTLSATSRSYSSPRMCEVNLFLPRMKSTRETSENCISCTGTDVKGLPKEANLRLDLMFILFFIPFAFATICMSSGEADRIRYWAHRGG